MTVRVPPESASDSSHLQSLPNAADEGLIRGLGVRALAANVVNLIVGSGIFVLPATVAALLGSYAIIAYVVCALGIGLITLCFAELGSRVTRSGGTYAYIEAAFGPNIGFIAGFLMWFGGDVISGGAVAALVIDSFAALVGFEGGPMLRVTLTVMLFATFTVANIRGVKTGAKVVEVLTVAKLAPLVFLILIALFKSDAQNFVLSGPPPLKNLGRATLILLFAFTGTEGALYTGGEVRKPATTVPRAIFAAMIVVTGLYIGVQLAAQGILGAELGTDERAPLATAAGRALGSSGSQLILTGMLISTMGFLSGSILAVPRALFAFARDGAIPRAFANVHPRFRTPHIAIVTHAALACAFALTGTFRALAVLSVVPTVIVYLGCCLATIKLRQRDPRTDGSIFRIPGGAAVPIAGVIFVLWLLSTATWTEWSVVAAIASLAVALRTATRLHYRGAVPRNAV
jgi:basic amino acid/polyamine antiporter, APA family